MISAIVILLMSLLVFLVGPHISIGDHHPFASGAARFSIIMLVIAAGFFKPMLQWLQENKGQYKPAITKIVSLIKGTFEKLRDVLQRYSANKIEQLRWRFDGEKNKRHFKKTPCYLLMGTPKSGKSQLFSNSGMPSVSAEYYGREAVQIVSDYQQGAWHFSDEAVFLEQPLKNDQGDNFNARQLIKTLKKKNKSRPLSGIVFTFSIAEILLAKHEDRRRFVSDFVNQTKIICQGLKVVVPIYVVLTKCDLVSGFSEFYSDMSKEDLSQVWGVTFPLEESHLADSVIPFFHNEYNQLMARLSQRVLWTMDVEKRQRSRELIYNFPSQMQLFRKPLATLLSELFSCAPNDKFLNLRGLYFTSGQQSGEPYDFFLHVIGRKYNLKSTKQEEQEQHNESYFINKLFSHVIVPEGAILGFSLRRSRLLRLGYHGSWFFFPALVLASFFALGRAYHQTLASASYVKNSVATFDIANNKLAPTDDHILDALPAINALYDARNVISASGMHQLLFVSHQLSHSVNGAFNRSLHSLFLPRIAANLEKNMQAGGMSTNALYASLKGYLAFSPSHYTSSDAIRAPMELSWSKLYKKKPKIYQALRRYIVSASRLNIDRLPLDRPLINRVRLDLQQVVPSKRAYALLSIKALASDLPDIDFTSVIGQGFLSIFELSPKYAVVPALYTEKGYQEVYQNNSQSIARQVADDNKEIGLHAESDNTQKLDDIVDDVQTEYNQHYLKIWQENINSITVRSFTSFHDAINKLQVMSANDSPFTKLLTVINDNTGDIGTGNQSVSKEFLNFNQFSQSSLTASKWAKIRKALHDLHDYLLAISSQADVNQSSFNAASAFMKGKKNPIYALSEQAKTAPKPIARWLNHIAQSSWQLIASAAMKQINNAWQASVLSEYSMHIKGRFPLKADASSELGMEHFEHFFAQQGTLDQFFTQYLAPFVNRQHKDWSAYQQDGMSLPLTQKDIHIFQSMKEIQDLYFDQNDKKPRLNFSIKPIELDRHAAALKLMVGNKQLNYAHGPQRPISISWPMKDSKEVTKCIISDFNGHHNVFTSYGEWSLFKAFSRHDLHAASQGQGYILTLHMGSHRAVFKILSDAPIDAFKLQGLNHFTLPKSL
jgi:type VI secretion system protein ImpL